MMRRVSQEGAQSVYCVAESGREWCAHRGCRTNTDVPSPGTSVGFAVFAVAAREAKARCGHLRRGSSLLSRVTAGRLPKVSAPGLRLPCRHSSPTLSQSNPQKIFHSSKKEKKGAIIHKKHMKNHNAQWSKTSTFTSLVSSSTARPHPPPRRTRPPPRRSRPVVWCGVREACRCVCARVHTWYC